MNEFIPGELGFTIAANSLHTGVLGELTSGLYAALEPGFAVVYVLALAAFIAWRAGDYRRGLEFGATVAATWLPVVFIKMLVARPRPEPSLLPHPTAFTPGDWSFPSGHTAFTMALAVSLFLFSRNRVLRILAVVLVPVVCATVLINGVHYPTDVAFSLVWSGALAPLWAKLACRAGSLLPERFGSDRGQLSDGRSERTYQPSTENLHDQTQPPVTARG